MTETQLARPTEGPIGLLRVCVTWRRVSNTTGERPTRPVPTRRCLAWPTALLLLTLLAPLPALAQRVALLIANADYAVGRLANPVNDMRQVAAALRAVGFVVQTLENANQAQMKRAVRDFGDAARGADIAFIYYAGHGTQAYGENYLIPLQASINKESDYDIEAVSANNILRQIAEARPKAAVLVLDACRDNPLAAVTRSTSRGLARMDPPTDTLVAFATAPGTTASDNGHYARALATQIRTPGLELLDVFRNTTAEVRRASSGQQVPRISEVSITERIFLAGAPAQPASPPSATDPSPPVRPAPAPPPVATAPKPGDIIKDCADCSELVILPEGRFNMGSPDSEVGRDTDEGPVHEVRIGYKLAVGRFELSRGEFGRFVQDSGYKTEAEQSQGCYVWTGDKYEYKVDRHWRQPGFAQTDSHPVVCISWNDAQAYLAWLNRKLPGKGYRLLSEAEWEYAARGGQGQARYPWGDDLANNAQCAYANGADASAKAGVPGFGKFAVANCTDGHAYTAPGDALRPNGFGLHHMHGNVWEWVQDVWHDNYQGEPPKDGSAWTVGGDQARRVLRGGSWGSTPQILRSAIRGRNSPADLDFITGVRIARTF